MANNNVLTQVITYNRSNLALLLNQNCFLSTANKKFNGFNTNVPKNLGDTVSFDLPPRFTTVNSLILATEAAVQRVHNLTVDKAFSVSYPFTDEQMIFNDVKGYEPVFAKSAMAELGAKVESSIASLAETNTYRFYGDGSNPINTYLQLANALAFFRNFGAAKDNTKGYLSDITVPGIVNSGLNQFTLDRGNREAMSWEVGKFSNCDWYQSNLLPTHTAGSEGIAQSVLTVVSTTLDANGAVTAITFSGTSAASDSASVKAYDKFQFSDGVSGKTNLRFRTFIGHEVSQSPVQFAATADAASTGGSQVTVTITPPLQAASGSGQNINTAIVAGMQGKFITSHRCGLITAGNPLYTAMPRLPDQSPFVTGAETDMDTGASLRTYYGTLFGQNSRVFAHDCILGRTLVPEYAMMIALPV
jgi:hypothetical protein